MSDPRVTDKVVGIAFAAFTSDKFAHPVQAMRSALEAAVPLLAPQPMVDREALIEAISARLHITTDLIVTGGHPRHLSADTSAVHEAADAVLALLNGSAT